MKQDPERLGYWRIVGLTTEGETIQLIRGEVPFIMWRDLEIEAAEDWTGWNRFIRFELQFKWSEGWGRPRKGFETWMHGMSSAEFRRRAEFHQTRDFLNAVAMRRKMRTAGRKR